MLYYAGSNFYAIQELVSVEGFPRFLFDKLESFLQLTSNEVNDCLTKI